MPYSLISALRAQYLLLAGTLSALWLAAWAGILADLVARAQRDEDAVQDSVRATGLVPVLLLAAATLCVAIPLPERCASRRCD